MKAVKRLNNNIVLCVDKHGNEIIARGKGIGFNTFPCDIPISQIERTYYDVDQRYIGTLNDLPDEVIVISTRLVDEAKSLINTQFNPNLVFILADHITFAIERYKSDLNFNLPIEQDVKYMFEKEYSIGEIALDYIYKMMHVRLPKGEAAYIALNIVNAENEIHNEDVDSNCKNIVEWIVNNIEKDFNIKINKESFNYSRFVSHMQFLLRRGKDKNSQVKSENLSMYQSLVNMYPKTSDTANKISKYLLDTYQIDLNEEEKLYIILHINRLCSREECNR